MVDIKDFVYDKFGIFDDAQDFADRLDTLKREFSAKSKVAQRLMQEVEVAIAEATSPEELERADTKEVLSVVKDLKSEMKKVRSEAQQLVRKAQKDPKIAKQVVGPLNKAMTAMDTFIEKMDETLRQVVLIERERRDVLRELQKAATRSAERRQRTVSSRAAKLVGTLAAAVVATGAIAFSFTAPR